MTEHYDVVIIGAGLAGLSLAQQLLLNADKTILLLEKRAEIPPKRQKVGEATSQVGAYYFSKFLDLEEHLLRQHFMKYNLRFYWKSAARENDCFEDYSQAYLLSFSNIATYQINRNTLEAELLQRNSTYPNFTLAAPITDLEVTLADAGPHALTFRVHGEARVVQAQWVVDTSGRGKFLAHRLGLQQPTAIHHGTSFLWVEGLVNIDKLTDRSPQEIRLRKERAALGHLPFWLATNHFMGEGFWFWVIPLQGLTSLGVVYDNAIFPRERVATPQQLIEWVCQEFPLFARDLPARKIIAHGSYRDFAYGCAQTIHPSRWALSGDAGRFTDPLYSPGSDFIGFHNSLITDAILTTNAAELAGKCQLYEYIMQAIYDSLIPSFAVSYNALGDRETFTLKYTWELSVYFSFFVFPFVNEVATNRLFALSYLGNFACLGTINKHLQTFLSDYYQWKRTAQQPPQEPVFHDFAAHGALRTAESTFYRVGVSVVEARDILDEQLANLKALALYIVAYVSSIVLADEGVLSHRAFIEGIDLQNLRFAPQEMHDRYSQCVGMTERYNWPFDPSALAHFRTESCQTEMGRIVAVGS